MSLVAVIECNAAKLCVQSSALQGIMVNAPDLTAVGCLQFAGRTDFMLAE